MTVRPVTTDKAYMMGVQHLPSLHEHTYSTIADDLCRDGLSIYDDFIPYDNRQVMREWMRLQWQSDAFRHARVGRGASLQLRPEIRSDYVLWLDCQQPVAPCATYFNMLNALKQCINRRCFLGLVDFEAHAAIYPPKASYGVHYDRFIGSLDRTVTCILYLNSAWQDEYGGQLRVYAGDSPSPLNLPLEITPLDGRLVCFISEAFPHEVLPASRDRMSITGWFRVRPQTAF